MRDECGIDERGEPGTIDAVRAEIESEEVADRRAFGPHDFCVRIGFRKLGQAGDLLLDHERLDDDFVGRFRRDRQVDAAQKLGYPNVITFFGNRKGRSDKEALDNCVTGLNRVKKVAEDHGVTICVELLNSKVDHPDYHGDKSLFGLEVVKAVGSPRVKLLYDIYHMQIMEGDVIRTIRDHHAWIAHYHTGGVPGRHELDDKQELNWRAVCQAIVDTGFEGYVAHEFVPTNKADPLSSLRAAAALCDV